MFPHLSKKLLERRNNYFAIFFVLLYDFHKHPHKTSSKHK
jgi:hypothetical protein